MEYSEKQADYLVSAYGVFKVGQLGAIGIYELVRLAAQSEVWPLDAYVYVKNTHGVNLHQIQRDVRDHLMDVLGVVK